MNPPNVNEELLKQLLQYLWQRHVAGEQQYLYWILGAPLLALFIFLLLWSRHRAHATTLLDALSFFFAPRGPEKMLIFKDLVGDRVLVYDYRTVKSGDGYLVQAGPYLIKTNEDPDAYAEPLSLVDARGPPGVPSPFGLFVRQLISVYMLVALVAISFVNTFYTTYDPYMKYARLIGPVTYTTVDLLAFAALVIVSAWLIAILVRALSPQTLVVGLSATGMSGEYIEASPGLDVYSGYPPARLLRAISREPRIEVPQPVFTYVDEREREAKQTFWDKLYEQISSSHLTASVLALLGQVYEAWRRSVGLLLQDRYDISVAARARYQLSEERLPRGFLSKYAGVLALLAIIGIIILGVVWLQPSLHAPTNTTATMITTTTSILPSPPTMPTPPTSPATTSITPAKPPIPGRTTTPRGG